MKYLYVAFPVIFDERKPIWWELVVPGIFTLIGSLIGAYLAGRYAVKAVEKQMEYDKDIKRISILESFLKESFILTSGYEDIFNTVEELKNYVQEDLEKIEKEEVFKHKFLSHESIYFIEHLISVAENNSESVSNINMNLIPFDIYYSFKSSINLLKTVPDETDMFYQRFLEVEDNPTFDFSSLDFHCFFTLGHFDDHINSLRKKYEVIKDYEKKSEEELNIIKAKMN